MANKHNLSTVVIAGYKAPPHLCDVTQPIGDSVSALYLPDVCRIEKSCLEKKGGGLAKHQDAHNAGQMSSSKLTHGLTCG